MAKKEKQEHKGPEEVAEELAEQKEQATDRTCAEEVEEVLKRHNRALQPYLAYSEVATVPRVRLVRVPADADGEASE